MQKRRYARIKAVEAEILRMHSEGEEIKQRHLLAACKQWQKFPNLVISG